MSDGISTRTPAGIARPKVSIGTIITYQKPFGSLMLLRVMEYLVSWQQLAPLLDWSTTGTIGKSPYTLSLSSFTSVM
jgi:hypothetical protein